MRPRVTIGQAGDDLGTPLVVPGERQLRSVDDAGWTALFDREFAAATAAANRAERCLDLHGYGCDRAECGRAPAGDRDVRGLAEYLGPATSADLLELDAVPNPIDSDAPVTTFGAQRPRTAKELYDFGRVGFSPSLPPFDQLPDEAKARWEQIASERAERPGQTRSP